MTLTIRTIVLFLCLFLAAPSLSVQAGEEMAAETQQQPTSYFISNIVNKPLSDGFTIRIAGNAEPAYTKYELVDPLRIVLDIADATVSDSLHLPIIFSEGPVSKITASNLDKNSSVTRLELFMAADPLYEVSRQGNDIVVAFSGDMKRTAQEEAAKDLQLTAVDIEKKADETVVHLRANGPLSDYKHAELPANETNPARFYIDLPNVKGDDIDNFISVDTTLAQIRTAQRDGALRLVFDATGDDIFHYEIANQPDGGGLDVRIAESTTALDPVARAIEQDDETDTPLMDTKKTKMTAQPSPTVAATEDSIPDNFSFSGYKQQRITVDFYKIDIHNVFRLIGEISNKNIVVDEGVSGSLTLALNDVPWDFALDIILNLKDLQKEERYNTIVISQKSKGFQWPEKAEDTIAIKANPLTVSKRIELPPPAILNAKRLLAEAQHLEEGKKYEEALNKYAEAFQAWPDNAQIPSRMAALYLVDLRLNAQAVHYAQAALKINGNDSNAALLAAIGLAKMERDAEAKDFFDIAVSDPKPSSDALLSYAAFQEEGGNYPAALTLLERHGDLYGDTLENFISKARLYDKNDEPHKAVEEYRAAQLSGYPLPQDLKRYIDGRIALGDRL